MALTTGLLLHRMVIAPIRRLLVRLENVSSGDYMTESGPHRNDESTLSIILTVTGDTARLTVQDTGPGFPADMSAGNTDSLGLRLVYALVDQIGGRIELKSHRGAIVSVEFPILET